MKICRAAFVYTKIILFISFIKIYLIRQLLLGGYRFAMPVDYIGFAYAATVAAGGIFGYAKAASIPSLSAGLIFGSILGYGAYQTTKNPNNVALSLGASSVLGGIMGVRYLNSGKVMPAGILAALSLAMVIRLGARQVIVWSAKNE